MTTYDTTAFSAKLVSGAQPACMTDSATEFHVWSKKPDMEKRCLDGMSRIWLDMAVVE